jgi:hypothetical protein
MMHRHLFLLACAAAGLASNGEAVADHRPIDRFGPMVKSIHDQPVPADIDGVRVLAQVLHLAHDPGAPYLARHAERMALQFLLGDPPAAAGPKVEHVILEMQSAHKSLAALRERVLERPVDAAPLEETDPALAPGFGWRVRHDGASVWTREDGGHERVMGVRVTNTSPRPLHSGRFTLHLHAAKPIRFECRYGALAVAAAMNAACFGDRATPPELLLAAVTGVARGTTPVRLEHHEVAFPLSNGRFEVRRHEVGFIEDDGFAARRAEEMVAGKSCGIRGSCASEAGGRLLAEPGLLGLVLGLVAGMVSACVGIFGGHRAARIMGTLFAIALGVAVVVALVTMFSSISKGPTLLVVFLGLVGTGKAAELVAGFGIGLVGTIALARALRRRK